MSLPEILFGLFVLEMFAGFPLADAMVRVTRRLHRWRMARPRAARRSDERRL